MAKKTTTPPEPSPEPCPQYVRRDLEDGEPCPAPTAVPSTECAAFSPPARSYSRREEPAARVAAKKIAAHAFAVLGARDDLTPGPTVFDVINAIRDAALSADMKCLLLVLATRIGRDGVVWVSFDRVAAEAGMYPSALANLLIQAHIRGFVSGEPKLKGPIGISFDAQAIDALTREMRAWEPPGRS